MPVPLLRTEISQSHQFCLSAVLKKNMPYNYTEETLKVTAEAVEPARKAKVIFLYLICVLGAPANLLSLFVLPRLQMKSSMKCCLQFLAAFSSLHLILRFLSIHIITKKLWLKILRHMALSASIWTTVLVSVMLFIAVRYPFKFKTFCTYQRIVFCNFLSVLIAMGLSVPRFFLLTEKKSDTSMFFSYFLFLNVRYGSQLRTLRKEAYMSEKQLLIVKSFDWLQVLMLYIVPALIVTILNLCVYRVTWKLKTLHRENHFSGQNEKNLARTVFGIIGVFLVSGAPWLILIIAIFCGSVTPITYSIAGPVLNPLRDVNSAANFVIYFVLNRDFRSTLLNMLHISPNRTNKVQDERVIHLNTTGKMQSEDVIATRRI